jgi:serine/threonine-protein kinase
MDFGLAKHIITQPETGALTQTMTRTATAAQAEASITGQGVVVGTIAYMSPEQAKGAQVDARTDIFSLGIVLTEIVTGKHPFDRPTPIETLTAVLRDSPPPVRV